MRNYKFRGKSIEYNTWVYGSLIKSKLFEGGHVDTWIKKEESILGILSTPTKNFIQVNPSTVGQFIEKYDREENELYEGDILSTSNNDPNFDIWDELDNKFTIIIWDVENNCWTGSDWFIEGPEEESIYNLRFVKKIGNIYDNLELEYNL